MSDQSSSDGENRSSSSENEYQQEEDDPIAKAIGNYGLWQFKMTFLLSLCPFPCTFHIFSPTFIAASCDFWCARPATLESVDVLKWNNYSQPNGSCTILDLDWSKVDTDTIETGQPPSDAKLVPCTSWEWDRSVVGNTIVSEWNLVCDRDYLNKIAEILFLFGIAVGGVVSGMISDRFGRKKTLVASLVMQTVLGILITFCPWYGLYLVQRVLLGFFSVSVVYAGFVLIVELVGGKWRTAAGICYFFPLPVSYILVGGLSVCLPDWRHLQLALSLPGIFLFSLWWLVPESPHWLLTMGQITETKEILQKAATFNKRKLPPCLDMILQPDGKPSSEVVAGVLDLFKGTTRKITLCVFPIWFATTMVYYSLVLNTSSFGGNLHRTAMLSGVVELPAIALSIPVLLKLGRRYPISLSLILAGACCLTIPFIDLVSDERWPKITLVMFTKFFISGTNGVLPLYTAELFPTLMRNLGVGASQVLAGIAFICIPFLFTLKTMTSMVVVGCIGVLGSLCVLLLPETANKPLTSVKYDKERTSGDNTVSNDPFTITELKTG